MGGSQWKTRVMTAGLVLLGVLFFGPLAGQIYLRRHTTEPWRVASDYFSNVGGFIAPIMTPVMSIVAVVLFIGLYFLPTWIARDRKHRNLLAVGVLNLTLGWTLLGWIAALVWACMRTQTEPKPQWPAAPADMRTCPECAELIKREARRCKHCGSLISSQ